MGNTVVLKDDPILHLLKKPADGADGAGAAAQVHIGIETLDLAGPVDLLLDYLAGGGHLLDFTRALGAGAIAGHEKTCGSNGPDGVDQLAQGVGAAPGDQENRDCETR